MAVMDRAASLKLLFEGDESLLELNTHLNPPPLVEQPATVVSDIPNATTVESKAGSGLQKHSAGHERSELQGNALATSKGEVSGRETFEEATDKRQMSGTTEDILSEVLTIDKIEVPIQECFCPILAVSRFPYKWAPKDQMQEVASRFFDGNKFWNRYWDLYYINVPPELGTRPLLLVPAFQVRKFLGEINKALESMLVLPTSPGFVLPFRNDETSQPTFLGQCTNKNMKDELERDIPLQSASYDADASESSSLLSEFHQKIRAGIEATKNKRKGGKPKKEQARVQNYHGLERSMRRAQCYLGLRPRCPRHLTLPVFNDQISPEEKESKMLEFKITSGIMLPHLAVNKPAPYPWWNEPIFICVDVESNERAHDQITEVGISTLDTLDLVGISPGEDAQNWMSRIRSRHFRTIEFSNVVNRDFIAGCPDRFEFGKSEWVSVNDLIRVVDLCFLPPYSAHVPFARKLEEEPSTSEEITKDTSHDVPEYKRNPRNLVFVGHSTVTDIAYLRSLNTTVFSDTPGACMPQFLDAVDTAELYRILRGEPHPRSLGHILSNFGIIAWNLHNAGNDARYTMEALVRIIVESRMSPNGHQIAALHGGNEVFAPFSEQQGNATEFQYQNEITMESLRDCDDWADYVDGGEPKGIPFSKGHHQVVEGAAQETPD